MADPEPATSAPTEATKNSNPPANVDGNDTVNDIVNGTDSKDIEKADANDNSSEIKEEATSRAANSVVKEEEQPQTEATTTNDVVKEDQPQQPTESQLKIEEPPIEEAALGRRPRRSRVAAIEAMAKTKPEPTKRNTPKPKAPEITQATLEANQKRQEALDNLNIGRLVEQFKHVPQTGQYYPHHGKLVEKLAAEGRIPDRWVVEWQNPTESTTIRRDEWLAADLEEHDALVENWQNPFRTYNGRRPEKTKLGQPLKNGLEQLRERYHRVVVRDIEQESFGKYASSTKGKASQNDKTVTEDEEDVNEGAAGDLLPTLVLIAALEDALQTSLQYQRAQEVERQQSEGNETAPVKKKNKNPLDTHPPLYYSTNPNQYLVAPSRAADAEEDLRLLQASRNPKAVVTPAILAQRIRDGCQWAWSYLQQEQSEGPKPLDAPGYDKISATAIELEAKKAQEAVLFPAEASSSENEQAPAATNGETAEQQQQRRSGRSGLGERTNMYDPGDRRSTRGGRGNASYADSSYIPEPNVVQKGGRVALWWLDTLEQEAKERQRNEKQAKSKKEESTPNPDKEEDEEMPDAEDDTKDTNETSAKQVANETDAAAKSNMITGDSYEDAMGGGDDEETATKDDDEDFDVSKDGDDEDSDDQLEDVEKERSLTPVPDLDVSGDEEEEDSDEEEIDEEHAIVWDNPYLTPSVPAILEYLSKPKSISGEDVQKAMDDIILRLRHNKRATSYGLPVRSLQSCDKAILHWENPDHPKHGSLVLKCVSGETVNELQRLDAQNFGRCKFELEIIGAEEKTIQIRNREDFEQRQEDYKVRKQLDKWRFKGLHEGYAIWPSWKDDAKEWISQNVVVSTEEAPKAENDDEALAKKLAEEAAAEEAASSRRTARRSRSSRGPGMEGGGGSGVFYGNQSSMTQRQLMDALIRLVKAQGMGTLSGLQELVSDDSTDPLRRIRIALGKILWKQNRLAKLQVSSARSDETLLKQLGTGKPLLALKQQQEEQEEEKNSAETLDLLDYLSHLHTTELRLRNLVLKQLGQIPLPVIATAADERPGSLENMDAPDFEDPSSIEWKTSGSDWISKLVYRPNSESILGDEHTPCYFYQITSWSESISSEADDAEENAVERRKRFQVVPHEHNGNTLILTEAQVSAGDHAARLKEQRDRNEAQLQTGGNPFASEIGERITLVAIDDDAESSNLKAPLEIVGRVVGQDTVLDASDASSEYRIFILPDDSSNSNGTAASPFWAVLDVRADDASLICQPEGQSKWYSIENQDFHVDSEPYKACMGVLEWLSRQSKAMPFMQPVDPVALGIPSYPDIVKHPMDISTMMEKLENGAYSNILPGQSAGNSLICRMLNGPFRKDVELIFDNAMLFNPPDDWIAQAAASLKKSVIKKIDTLSYASEKKHMNGGASQRKSMYADEDSDVDMYEYESDNDEEYTTSRRGKRKRSTQNARGGGNKDEAAARPMEQQIRLQNCLKDGNDLRGRFSGLPLNGYASTYSMPSNWSCRRSALAAGATEKESDNDDKSEEEETPQENQEYAQEMADLLALQKRFGEAEASNLRRSSRETRPTAGRRSNRDKTKDAKKTEGLEYYRLGTEDEIATPSIPSNRLDVEVLLEKRHEEHYAKLYSAYETSLMSSNEEKGFAMYSNGSFPPYLGRVVPSKNAHGFTWEIRPPFAVPALRWVLRGLIVSGHLTAIEPMFSTVSTTGTGTYDYTTSGVIISNDVYYYNPETCKPFEVLDTRELQRKKRAGKSDDSSEEDEVEMSEYEKLRAERVARNAERLKALGLA